MTVASPTPSADTATAPAEATTAAERTGTASAEAGAATGPWRRHLRRGTILRREGPLLLWSLVPRLRLTLKSLHLWRGTVLLRGLIALRLVLVSLNLRRGTVLLPGLIALRRAQIPLSLRFRPVQL